ncbi:MAG: hypothetical protein M1825_005742 [Sarcosagium campestre]|nr:MAG: hypothetical protein M1825_005742 [Sarcosagium campestre]
MTSPQETKTRAPGSFIVKDAPKLDLEAYIANYEGRTRLRRLLFIGENSTFLSHDALKAAVIEAKQGQDTNLYLEACSLLRKTAPEDADATPDQAWLEDTVKAASAETERLEFELKGYKNNLIKESIRMGNEELGDQYRRTGALQSSARSYERMRDFCNSPKQVADMCQKLIVVSVEQENWLAVQSNVFKIKNLHLSTFDLEGVLAKNSAAVGLAHLASGHYKEAAKAFLGTDISLGSSFNQVLTSNDVAVYGGLCALASMDRAELKARVLDSASFRNFLELEPHIRRGIAFFCSSKYAACLDILNSYTADYMLDIYLAPHMRQIIAAVRLKSIVQYFIPYSCVTLESMAKAFATTVQAIQDELIAMIENGVLDARIDLHRKLLVANIPDQRVATHLKALETAERHERVARHHLMRMSILASGLELKPQSLRGTTRRSDLILMDGMNTGFFRQRLG